QPSNTLSLHDALPIFKSKSIKQRDLNNFLVTGDLTMRGITKEVQVPIAFNGVVTTRMGPAAGFSGNLVLKLSDFQVPFTREFERSEEHTSELQSRENL